MIFIKLSYFAYIAALHSRLLHLLKVKTSHLSADILYAFSPASPRHLLVQLFLLIIHAAAIGKIAEKFLLTSARIDMDPATLRHLIAEQNE